VTLTAISATPNAPLSSGLLPAGVLDALALARLQELDPGGEAGLLARVLATYTRSLQRLLEQLRQAREASDVQAQRHVAHTLKSSSASVGALQLSALCADIERRLRDAATDGLDSALDALAEEGERLLGVLRPAE
jgi:histidine phosphotransfer protein HptB